MASPCLSENNRRIAFKALSALDDQRTELFQTQQELHGAVQSLRHRSSEVRCAVEQAAVDLKNYQDRILNIVAQVETCLASRVVPEDLHTSQEVVARLEQRLSTLQLQEGEQRRMAELQLLRSELAFESLAARATEAERQEAEAAVAASSSLPELKAQVAEEELELHNFGVHMSQTETDPDEQLCFEWYHMLAEDHPEHSSLSAIEAASEAAEEKLHELVPRASLRGTPVVHHHGLKRLDAELLDFGNVNGNGKHTQRITCRERLEHLSECGPWRLLFREMCSAYSLVEELRNHNDSVAKEVARLRWQRLNCVATPPARLATSFDISGGDSPRIPRGPRFEHPC